MAYLRYANLQVPNPQTLLRGTFDGLGIYYQYLKRTRDFMNSDAAVKRLAWRDTRDSRGKKRRKKEEEQSSGPVWIELTEPEDRPNEPEQTFALFTDENTSEVYESPAPVRNEENRRPQQMDFSDDRKIGILARDPKSNRLQLERLPDADFPELLIRPNTYPVQCQIRAMRALQDAPAPEHLPLLRLFMPLDQAEWPEVSVDEDRNHNEWGYGIVGFSDSESDHTLDWKILTEPDREGTDSQRLFVKKAMKSPDFSVLEGPPGSGKTTVICELILQLAMEGKRVLLCASTHVAVDNVLERLMAESNEHRDHVVPVRIGDSSNVSEFARQWQLQEFIRTEGQRVKAHLRKQEAPSNAQKALLKALGAEDNELIQRLVLETANLICGTTIGILQHPTIKGKRQEGKFTIPEFDVLIIDEASKTPFQEFLVPALLAKKWVVVGDPKQLSPYVDDEAMATNVESCLPEPLVQQACIDVFSARQFGRGHRSTIVIADDDGKTASIYRAQAQDQVELALPGEPDSRLEHASIVVCETLQLADSIEKMPLDLCTVRGGSGWEAQTLQRRARAWRRLSNTERDEDPSWSSEIAWRLARHFEQRFSPGSSSKRLFDQVQEMLPVDATGYRTNDVRQQIDQVRRVALPSVLEVLQFGSQLKRLRSLEDLEPGVLLSGRIKNIEDFGAFVRTNLGVDGLIHISRLSRERVEHPSEVVSVGQQVVVKVRKVELERRKLSLDLQGAERSNVTAMTQGLPTDAFEQRHVLLEFQHRMHPDISAFSRVHVYDNNALFDPYNMQEKRQWGYAGYQHRAIWLDVRGRFNKLNRNREEAETIMRELQAFCDWASTEPRADGQPWEVAVLTFYRGQERELREHLRRITGQKQKFGRFTFGSNKNPEVVVHLCTVDRFQGHEADLVFLSFANTRPTIFLQSPNRLNVALTRARYQLVIVGNRGRLGKGRDSRDCGPVLRSLLDESKVGYRWAEGGES